MDIGDLISRLRQYDGYIQEATRKLSLAIQVGGTHDGVDDYLKHTSPRNDVKSESVLHIRFPRQEPGKVQKG